MSKFKAGDRVFHSLWNLNGTIARVEFMVTCYFYVVDFDGVGAKRVSFQHLELIK